MEMITMNTTTRTVITAVATVVAMAAASGTAFGAPPRDPVPAGAASSVGSPYAEPIDAIGGRTMAQYVADHQEQRTR